MTQFNLRRYVARETMIGIVINVLVATVAGVTIIDVSAATAVRPIREIAVGLTPQFFMAALMSALVPSLLLCRKQAGGRLGLSPRMSRLRPDRAAVIAAGLAVAFTILFLALIHVIVAPLAGGGIETAAILALRVAQAVLAAATVTPLAILLLLGTAGMYAAEVVVVGRDPAAIAVADDADPESAVSTGATTPRRPRLSARPQRRHLGIRAAGPHVEPDRLADPHAPEQRRRRRLEGHGHPRPADRRDRPVPDGERVRPGIDRGDDAGSPPRPGGGVVHPRHARHRLRERRRGGEDGGDDQGR